MSSRELNLARRPFVNERPVRRISLLMWIAGAGLALANACVYTEYFSAASLERGQESELRQAVELEEERIADLEKALAGLDLEQQNEKAIFFNQLIKQRTFSWSRLFDDLATTLPEGVRLSALAPRFQGAQSSSRRRRAERESDEVLLQIRGAARDGQALLELVDALFASAAFRRPDLSQEAVEEGDLSNFDLTVLYIPTADRPAPQAGEEGPLGETLDVEPAPAPPPAADAASEAAVRAPQAAAPGGPAEGR